MEELIKRLERVIQTGVPDEDGMHPISAEAVLEVVKELSEHGTNLAEVGTDLISRQAAINALKEHRALYCDNTPDAFSKLSHAEKSRVDELDTAIATLVNLPPAEPKRGKWIDANICGELPVIVCDQCHTFFPIAFGDFHNFCPNCGAKMEEKT